MEATDKFSQQKRSRIMASIKSSNTSPEITVRKLLYKYGYRYRLHVKGLPATPDIVLRKNNTVIFINGCFWHHHGCYISHLPKSNSEFWLKKIRRNLERDKESVSKLLQLDWRILIIWECAISGKKKLDQSALIKKISTFLESSLKTAAIEG